jgi:hypothetical protein
MKGLDLRIGGFLGDIGLSESVKEWMKEMEKVFAKGKRSVSVKAKDLARKIDWASAKGKAKAGDFPSWFASKRLSQSKPKKTACLRLQAICVA